MDWLSFLSYVFLNCITPGPNNTISLSGAAQRGFLYSLRYIGGASVGFFASQPARGQALRPCSTTCFRAIEPWLLALGSAYILYLARQVWRSEPGGGGDAARSRGVFSGIAMQFINVKGILFAVTAMGSYVLPHYSGATPVVLVSLLMAASCFVCCCAWALCGAVLERAYRKHTRAVNGVMALALVWCAAELVLELINGLTQA